MKRILTFQVEKKVSGSFSLGKILVLMFNLSFPIIDEIAH